MWKKKFFFAKKIFQGGGRLTLSKKNFSGLRPEKFFFGYTWIHLDTPGNCQVLPDTPERPEKCPRVWFLGPGVSRSFQGGAQCTKIDFRGSFRGARVKIENQDKTNIDFFPYSGTTGFRSNFWYLLWKSAKKLTKCQNLFSQNGRKMTFH